MTTAQVPMRNETVTPVTSNSVLYVVEMWRELREREREREYYGGFDNISCSEEKRQQMRCYKDTEFLGAKYYDKRPQNNDTLIVQTRIAYRYTQITHH